MFCERDVLEVKYDWPRDQNLMGAELEPKNQAWQR